MIVLPSSIGDYRRALARGGGPAGLDRAGAARGRLLGEHHPGQRLAAALPRAHRAPALGVSRALVLAVPEHGQGKDL
jgi:hypothetical protein